MAKSLTCAVIGGGVIGAAAAYHLAGRAAHVHLFDQFDLFHMQGSSHGATRLFRMAYFEHPDYVPLLRRADEGWRALEAAAGETIFHRTGIFLSGPGDGALTAGTLKASEDHGLPIRRLTAHDVRSRFPWFDPPADFDMLTEPRAGVLRADRACAAFINGARACGAEISTGAKILGWSARPEGVEIATGEESHVFDRLVVAPGAWAASLLGDIGAQVKPLRKFLFWAACDDQFAIDGAFLPFAIERRDGRVFYGVPAVDADGVKMGEHSGGVPLSAPEDDAPAGGARADLAGFLEDLAPGLPHAITKEQTCLYAMSPDGHFIIDVHPDDSRVAFAAGFSGHGFKFAPVIGEALADLTFDGETLQEFDFLKLARFGASAP